MDYDGTVDASDEEKNVKQILLATGALLLSTAAVAQMPPPPGFYPRGGWDAPSFWRGAPDRVRDRIQFLQDRVNRGRANGSLNRGEAARVDGELNSLRAWIAHKHWEDRGPLGPNQSAEVQGRLDQISRQIQWMRHDGW